MKFFGGRRTRTLTWFNQASEPLRVWLEPWAEEFSVGAGARIDLILSGKGDLNDIPVDVTPTHFAVYAPSGTLVKVLIDGEPQPTWASESPAPPTGKLGMREFAGIVFDAIPEARLAGKRAEAADDVIDELGAPLASGEVRLEALVEVHRAALKAACAEDLDIWPIYAWSWDPDHFDATFDRVMALANWRRFAIFSGGRLVGMSCFIGIDAERGVLEIGNTYYVPEMRGTGFNRIVKDLMLGRAIDCGFRRIEFRVDSRNARSQAAMAKLGAVREGVIRADRITWTGHVRDTVLFSILADEWPSR